MLGVFVAAAIIPGIDYSDNKALLIVVVLLGLFNAFLRPLLILFALPFVILTLGFGILFINAALLMLAAKLVDGFMVESFFSAFLGAVIIAIVNLFLGNMIGDSARVVRFKRKSRGPRGSDDIIDI